MSFNLKTDVAGRGGNRRSPRNEVLGRMIEQATLLGPSANVSLEEWVECPHEPGRRWRLTDRWVEFECGCRAERARVLYGAQPWDPIVFPGLPEQAVYDNCCDRHMQRMRFRLSFGGNWDFKIWHERRRPKLLGR